MTALLTTLGRWGGIFTLIALLIVLVRQLITLVSFLLIVLKVGIVVVFIALMLLIIIFMFRGRARRKREEAGEI